MIELLYLFAGLVFGGLLLWFISKYYSSKKINELNTGNRIGEERLSESQKDVEKLNAVLLDRDGEILRLSTQMASRNADYQNLEKKLQEQKKEMEDLQGKFKNEFRILASEILEEKTRKFTEQNKENLGQILNPLGDKIRDFEKKVHETYEKGLKDQTDLKAELKRLHELSLKLDEDAKNLTNALRADTKKQGNWGEVVLERILERSGLVKDQEYSTQPSVRNEDGELVRPDVIVNLPDNKHIVIDSKVSLLAYEAYTTSDDEEKKNQYLKQHIDSIKTHIKNLSEKNYQHALSIDTPDFVLLFLPIESAFSLAIQTDLDLFNYAWAKKIVVVSPTTLLATLRTVASIWKHEKQTQNAIEIARQGGALYDKFVSFLKDLERVGSQLHTLQKTYDDAHKKISSGKGNLIGRAEKLKDLGARVSKQLPGSFIEEQREG